MNREIIKIDVADWDVETLHLMTEVLHDIESDDRRKEFAHTVSTMSPRMARVYAQELKNRKMMSGLL